MDRDLSNGWYWAVFFLGGLIVVASFLPEVDNTRAAAELMRIAGGMLMGQLPIQAAIHRYARLRERREEEWLQQVCQFEVRRVVSMKPSELPVLIATDIEGCVTPPLRAELDLRKFQALRAYCEFARVNRQYPPLIFFTGRSQGYVELLAQSLGMLDHHRDVPFVIENGAAVYYPNAKRTRKLLSDEQENLIQDTYRFLKQELSDQDDQGREVGNEFEPKSYMVTINPREGQTIQQLNTAVQRLVGGKNLIVNRSATAIDITAAGIDKYSGLAQVISELSDYASADWTPLIGLGDQPDPATIVGRVVAMGDAESDAVVLERAGSIYTTQEGGDAVVKDLFNRRGMADRILKKEHIDFVIEAIERECGIEIVDAASLRGRRR